MLPRLIPLTRSLVAARTPTGKPCNVIFKYHMLRSMCLAGAVANVVECLTSASSDFWTYFWLVSRLFIQLGQQLQPSTSCLLHFPWT